MTGKFDPKFLAFFMCPISKAPLEYDADRDVIVSRAAGVYFPVNNGEPDFRIASARKLTDLAD